MEFPQKTKNRTTMWSSNFTPGCISEENKNTYSKSCTPVFIAALFIFATIQMHPKCPSADKWIKKMWYIFKIYGQEIKRHKLHISSVQSLSRVRLFATPWIAACPGLPVHHQLPEFTQTHVHRVSDAIQPSHPLSSPSPPAPNPSQHQSLFQCVSSLHEVAKVLEFQLQHHSLLRNTRADLLQNGLVGSPCSPRDSHKDILYSTGKKANIS